MRRVVIPELLDRDAGSPEEIAASLRDLRWINRWFGGVRTLRLLLRDAMRAAGLTRATLLSVAAGDAFAPACASAALARTGLDLGITVLDRSSRHLRAAPQASRVAADALALPFAAASFDFVECSLFAHHLEPQEVVAFAREALRVARHALLVNDLRRSRGHLLFATLGCALYSSRLTRHDARASVRRAYTAGELRALLADGDTLQVTVTPRWFFRSAATVRRRERAA